MASPHTTTSSLLRPLLRFLSPLTSTTNVSLPASARAFSTSSPMKAKKDSGKKVDPRITLIRYHLQHPSTPRPLRLSRMRGLRHWTIHRAWMLLRRKQREAQGVELQRQYQSIHSAMEELRTTDGEGQGKDRGRLYRVAMEKKGIFGKGGVPIEYARLQTDTPGREAWNHAWTR